MKKLFTLMTLISFTGLVSCAQEEGSNQSYRASKMKKEYGDFDKDANSSKDSKNQQLETKNRQGSSNRGSDTNDFADECDIQDRDLEYQAKIDDAYKVKVGIIPLNIKVKGPIGLAIKQIGNTLSMEPKEAGPLDVTPAVARSQVVAEQEKGFGTTFYTSPNLDEMPEELKPYKCYIFFAKSGTIHNAGSKISVSFSKPVPISINPNSDAVADFEKEFPQGLRVNDVTTTVTAVKNVIKKGELEKLFKPGDTVRGNFEIVPEDGGFALRQDLRGKEEDIFGAEKTVQYPMNNEIERISITKNLKAIGAKSTLTFKMQ